ASVLASQGREIGSVAVTMLVFGLGAALPLLILGTISRDALMRMRGRLMNTGGALKSALGIFLVVVGLAILTGWDKRIEASLVNLSPDWLTTLTTRF
ncbi:MAG: cytochrome c biogenesis protein CcdA, partial [Beijerinckiaceae bacterium]